MSAKVMGHVWDLELSHNQLIVLLAYADHASHDGTNIFPSVGLMAYKTGYSERTIQRITKELVEEGYLLPEGKTQYGTNLYRFNFDAGTKKAPYKFKEDGGDKMSGGDTVMSPGGDTQMSPGGCHSYVTRGGDTQMSPKPSHKPSVETIRETVKDSAGAEHNDPFSDFVETLDLGDDDANMEPEQDEPPEPPEEPAQGRQYPKNALQEAVAFAFKIKPGAFAGVLGQQLTGTTKDGERHKYRIDPPMTPHEIAAFGIWYKHEYREQSDRPPKSAELLRERVLEFRDHKLYERAMEKGTERLNAILGIEPQMQARPEPTEEERAEIDNLISDLVDTFTKGSGT